MTQPALAALSPPLLTGYTFVLTGIAAPSESGPSRDEWVESLKQLGGRVTSAVSSKTHYLVLVGPTLEDGRPSTEGSKYLKASSLIAKQEQESSSSRSLYLVEGPAALNGLLQQYATARLGTQATSNNNKTNKMEDPTATETSSTKPPPATAAAAAPPVKRINPYATTTKRTTTTNPYAKKAKLDHTRSTQSQPPTSTSSTSTAVVPRPSSSTTRLALWVDRYQPQATSEILGNQDAVRKLKVWLRQWEDKFNKDSVVGKPFSNPQGPWKAALLSGPPGIGSTYGIFVMSLCIVFGSLTCASHGLEGTRKWLLSTCSPFLSGILLFLFVLPSETTTATLVVRESGREVVEYNASDVRSKKALKDSLGDITGSQSIQFSKPRQKDGRIKRCIIMDEVDGMGAGDHSGMKELIQMIKHSRVPIICICNDRQSPKVKSLAPYCMDLKYRRPTKMAVAQRAVQVGAQEGFTVEYNAAESMAESCGNDVRQVLNALQMWASSSTAQGGDHANTMTYTNLKERERAIHKDEILRVSLFDAARLLLEGRRGVTEDPKQALSHFFHRNDAFFVDYSFTGLLVQQNYLKVMQGAYNAEKRQVNTHPKNDEPVLERMYKAAASMSDYAHAENLLRTEQNWSVLPFVASLVVKTGYHAGGERGGMVPGFPEFTTWLGRNSTKGKRQRLLSELNHHMNYRISGGTTELRLSYLPTLRGRFVSLLTSKQDKSTDQAIQLMDEYGLDRDDVLESMDEFRIDSKTDKSFAQLLDSKVRAAFTRNYNATSHKSQALVAEQGQAAGGKRGKAGSSSSGAPESLDPDTINDDDELEQDDEDDDEEEFDTAKLAALFKKSGRKASTKATAGKKKPAATKGRKKK